MFPHECLTPDQIEIDRLRMENRALRQSLDSARTASRVKSDALRRVLGDMQLLMERAAPKQPSSLLLQHGDQAAYQLASGLDPTKPFLDSAAGKELVGHVVDIMSRHLTEMVAHVHFRFGIVDNPQKAHVLRVVLASVLMWVFGVHLPDWDAFAAPKLGLTLGQEIPSFLRAAMYLRSYHSTKNKFPISLLHTFIVNWNSFAKEQIGVHPLPLDSSLGLSHMPLQVILFPSNLDCTCAVFKHRVDKRQEYSIRLYLVKKSNQNNDRPPFASPVPSQPRPPPPPPSPAVLVQQNPKPAVAATTTRALTVPPPPPPPPPPHVSDPPAAAAPEVSSAPQQ